MRWATFPMSGLVAILIAGPSLSVAASKPANPVSKPNSYVPQPSTANHIYGAPIARPIIGHAKASHHKHTRKNGR